MTADPDVLSLPTPLARLYGTAMALGVDVRDHDLSGLAGAAGAPGGVIAVVGFGNQIRLSPRIDPADLPDVMAMCLSVAAQMVPSQEQAARGDIVAEDGYVFILADREDDPAEPAGKIATKIARRCGAETASAAFAWWVPETTG